MHGAIGAWFRQTPAHDGRFGGTLFRSEPANRMKEWLVVCDDPPSGFRTRIPRERRVLFLGEPPGTKAYAVPYLNQFGTVVGPTRFPGYTGRQIVQHASLPWHYGKTRPLSWDRLMMDKGKSAAISVFCSDKTFTPQQVRRIAFVEKLKRHFGELVDHFGNGTRSLPEKADGLDAYRYTVVLENNLDDDFWTEKLADAYLGHCFPIYAGGKVRPGDFDPAARLDIDMCEPDSAFRQIEALLNSEAFEKSEPLIREQRMRVMFKHNLFAVADCIIRNTRARCGLLLRPEKLRQNGRFAV
jgi:hypothetical protein